MSFLCDLWSPSTCAECSGRPLDPIDEDMVDTAIHNDRMHRGHSVPRRARQMILVMMSDVVEDDISFQSLTREVRILVEVADARPVEARGSVCTTFHSCRRLGQAHFNGLRGKRTCAGAEVIAHRCAYYSASQLSSYSIIIKREACPSPACTGIAAAGGTP
jgi:hypothetical protein